jgi:hypothetical protein
MSTRSIIVISTPERTLRLYKHCDGYPTDTLPLVALALAAPVPGTALGMARRITADDSGARLEWDSAKPDAGENCDGSPWGMQADLEWIYQIDTAARAVRVYGGGYTGDVAGVMVARGVVEPGDYADGLYDEYQHDERTATAAAVAGIVALGWTVNPEPSSVDMWQAIGACGGSVQFDTEPSRSDVRNACEDLARPIRVYAVTCRETARELVEELAQ